MFNLEKPYKQLGYPQDGGYTAYFSENMKKEDLKLVKEFLDNEEINILNTRAFKVDDRNFIISVGSINEDKNKIVSFKDKQFELRYGEFKEYLKEVNANLNKAIPFSANEN